MRAPSDPAPRVVIVAFHADDHLRDCLAFLGRPERVVVIDNGRSDATRGIVEAAGATYLESPGNVGFARGVNLALATRTHGEDVLLLNPDARISWPDVLTLHAVLHDPARRLAAVGPALVDEHGAQQAADWPLPSPAQVWLDAFGQGARYRGPRFVTGAVLLLRGDAIDEVGGLDERYFLYAEEADWQMAAQRGGRQVAVVPEVTAVHVGAASSSDSTVRARHFHASGRLFARRWYGPRGALVMRLGSVVAALRRLATGGAAGRADALLALRLTLAPRPAGKPAGPGHVVHVVRSDGFAGVERYLADVAPELARRGWRVTVIGGDPERMRRELPPEVAHVPATTVVDVARALWSVGRADVVHAHMTAAELPAALLRRRTGGRFVVTRHFAGHRGSSAPARLAGRLVAARVDRQISISEFVAAAVEGESVVVPNGVATSSVPEAEREVVRGNTVVVLQRFEAEKDTATALQAWRLSGLAGRGWQLELYGRGAERAALEKLAAELGVTGSVTFGGFVDDPRARIAAASIMLATAHAEPFGLSVVEAMAEGTPVVAARGGAHVETLGEHGRYFPPGDAAAAARQLVALADSPVESTALGATLRARQRTVFSVPAHVDALEDVYVR